MQPGLLGGVFMAFNFIAPLFYLLALTSLTGTIIGIVKKNKKLRNIALIIFVSLIVIFIILEGFIFE